MAKKRLEIPPITPETTLENARKWLNIIRYGESGTVIQLQDDCEYRVLEIITNPKILKSILGPFYKKYLLAYIPIDQKDLNKTIKETLIQLCTDKKIGTKGILNKYTSSEILEEIANKGYDVGLFISHVNQVLKVDNFQPLIDLEYLIRTNKNLSVILFSEKDIFNPKFKILTDKASFMYDHVIRYPLYSETDSKQFIKHYCNHWDFILPEKTINEIISACGGYLWLIHQAQRNLRDNKNISCQEALTDDLMFIKLDGIWSKFTDEEKLIIRKVSYGNVLEIDTLSHSYKYLLSIGVIKESSGKIDLGIPLLSQVIEKENRLNKFQTKNDHILLGERDFTTSLSRKERAFMRVLLSSKNKIVTRDMVAQMIWGKSWEEKYSDWALDRLAHRLRLKLKKLGIDVKLFRTVKKKGFVFG